MSSAVTNHELPNPLIANAHTDSGGGIRRALDAARAHLGMDVAFVSEFVGDHRFFREVSASQGEECLKVGDSLALEEGYCQRVIDGRLPELIPDTGLVPAAKEMPITASLPIGAHLSVPLRLKDGRLYGTFCCFSHAPDRSLNERDLKVMRAFADLTAYEIDRDLEAGRLKDEKMGRVRDVMERGRLSAVYQPIYRIEDR